MLDFTIKGKRTTSGSLITIFMESWSENSPIKINDTLPAFMVYGEFLDPDKRAHYFNSRSGFIILVIKISLTRLRFLTAGSDIFFLNKISTASSPGKYMRLAFYLDIFTEYFLQSDNSESQNR